MNVIEVLKNLLSDCPLMDEFNNEHIDYNEDVTGNYGIYSVGTNKIKEDIVGNATYVSDFILYANNMAYDDITRLSNASWLMRMTYWLDKQKNFNITEIIDGFVMNGIITKITASNGMMFSVPTGDINDGVNYQIQIKVTYEFKEEF